MFRTKELSRRWPYAAAIFSLLLFGVVAQAQTSVFIYQGRLTDSNAPANGLYDFEFHLYNDASVQIGPALPREDVQVTNGVFTVSLDFGPQAFDGSARLLEIGVRPGASTEAFTALAPRQTVNSTPYSIRSLSAAQADAADKTGDSQKLGGVDATQYVKTDDPRLTAGGGPPAPGSPNYIQNTTTPQTAAFNISGDGTAGGTLSGKIVSAGTQFNIGTNRILKANSQVTSVGLNAGAPAGVVGNSFFGSSAGKNTTKGGNSFFGSSAGGANTTGNGNSFFGSGAGSKNVEGVNNSFFGVSAGANTLTDGNAFFGSRAGFANKNGTGNAFFGASAGTAATGNSNSLFGNSAGIKLSTGFNNSFFGTFTGGSTTTGSANTFVGLEAGSAITTEDLNTFIGFQANGVAGVHNATAIGAHAVVTSSNSLVLGANALVGIGTSAPRTRLEVANGTIYVSTAGRGLILKSPDGSVCRVLTLSNQGVFVTQTITCP